MTTTSTSTPSSASRPEAAGGLRRRWPACRAVIAWWSWSRSARSEPAIRNHRAAALADARWWASSAVSWS